MGNSSIGTVAITLSLLGIAFLIHFSTAAYYFVGNPPTGFSTGTLGLAICILAVLLAGFAATQKE